MFGLGCSLYPILYHKTFSISRTKSQNLNVSCLLLQCSLLNPLKPGVKLPTKVRIIIRGFTVGLAAPTDSLTWLSNAQVLGIQMMIF